jgi:hypothetical protein
MRRLSKVEIDEQTVLGHLDVVASDIQQSEIPPFEFVAPVLVLFHKPSFFSASPRLASLLRFLNQAASISS